MQEKQPGCDICKNGSCGKILHVGQQHMKDWFKVMDTLQMKVEMLEKQLQGEKYESF